MMTNELRAAAERLTGNSWDVYIPHPDTKRDWMDIADKTLMDGRAIARAYLAEHDETPITADWLRSVGGLDDTAGAIVFVFHEAQRHIAIEEDGSVAIGENDYDRPMNAQYIATNAVVKTRGQLIRLAKALGIELKEIERED